MIAFLKFIAQTFKIAIGTLLGIFAFFAFALAILAIVAKSSNDVVVEDSSVLRITLSEEITEFERSGDPLSPEAILGDGEQKKLPLLKALKALKHAASDDRIKGIIINANGVSAGFAALTELRNALLEFKQSSGKFVYAYSDGYSEGAYYIASLADSIYLHPQGDFEMNGLASERMFYKGMFDKFGIKPEIFRVGGYKSAVEPYFMTGMSSESRYQSQVYMDSLNNRFLREIAISRGLTYDTVRSISGQMLVRNPAQAVGQRLITRLAYKDYVEDVIKTKLGIAQQEKINYIGMLSYIDAEKPDAEESDADEKIAVIVAEGEIRDGNSSGNGIISGKYVASQIRKAREDEDVKAIVLRINSPGGSALASDIMWREVQLTKGVKPIIASMSDVAASGGYYMAMGCDKIVAMPNTITGSIGIFSVYFDAEGFLQSYLGLNTEEIGTGKFSNIASPTDAFTDEERAILQRQIEEGYENFTSKAAQGRNLSLDSLKALAQGRVWVGADALRIGLVDQLGDFEDAIALAASSAGLSDYQIKYYAAEAPEVWEKWVGGASTAWKEQAVKEELGTLYPTYKALKRLEGLKGVQALMPFEIKAK
jgi:protease-4